MALHGSFTCDLPAELKHCNPQERCLVKLAKTAGRHGRSMKLLVGSPPCGFHHA